MERIRLSEFLEIMVPTRDRTGRALGEVKQNEWKERLARYMLETLQVTGFQESKREKCGKSREKISGNTTRLQTASTW